MKKRMGMVAFISLAIFLISSCNKNPANSLGNDDLIGKWILTKEEIKMDITGGGFSTKIDTTILFSDNDDYIEFKSDNTFLSNINEEMFSMGKKKIGKIKNDNQITPETGKWSLSGNTLKMFSSLFNDTTIFTVSINGSNITLTQNIDEKSEESGITITYKGVAILYGVKK